jgi:hypothetical protein
LGVGERKKSEAFGKLLRLPKKEKISTGEVHADLDEGKEQADSSELKRKPDTSWEDMNKAFKKKLAQQEEEEKRKKSSKRKKSESPPGSEQRPIKSKRAGSPFQGLHCWKKSVKNP